MHNQLWKMLPAVGNRIYQVKLGKNTAIATLTLQDKQLLMTCTSHPYVFALANDFLIEYRNGLYFLSTDLFVFTSCMTYGDMHNYSVLLPFKRRSEIWVPYSSVGRTGW